MTDPEKAIAALLAILSSIGGYMTPEQQAEIRHARMLVALAERREAGAGEGCACCAGCVQCDASGCACSGQVTP